MFIDNFDKSSQLTQVAVRLIYIWNNWDSGKRHRLVM